MGTLIDETRLKRAVEAFWKHAWHDDDGTIWSEDDGLYAAVKVLFPDDNPDVVYAELAPLFVFGRHDFKFGSVDEAIENAVAKLRVLSRSGQT